MDNIVKPEKITPDIIYENDDVLVINKKAGMLVHPDKYNKTGTLVNALLNYYPEISNVGEKYRPGIVHRLDKETSGLVICAKTNDSYDYLTKQFKERKAEKKYKALVYGKVKKERGVIIYSISKIGRSNMQEAKTYYNVLQYYKNFTLLDAEIKTGRMHQIRQHMKRLGHPIVGDKLYFFKNLKPPYPINQNFLHAYYLKLEVPSGEAKEFKIDLPENLLEYLKNLPKD